MAKEVKLSGSAPGRLARAKPRQHPPLGLAVSKTSWPVASEYAPTEPASAAVVLASGVPITLIPLDATNTVPITIDFYDRLQTVANTPAARLAVDLLAGNEAMVTSGDYFFWDPLAAAVLTEPTLAEFTEQHLSVVVQGAEAGRVLPDPSGAPVRVAVSADAARFEQLFIETLNAP